MTIASTLLLAGVVVGTWNANWFPTGAPDLPANPAAEQKTIAEAGKMLRAGLSRLDPSGTNDLILCLNEIRDRPAAAALAVATGRTNLIVAAITRYRFRDRLDAQQDAILTTIPVVEASWALWKSHEGVLPPRGYARARLILEPAVTATVYCVHLKSNFGAESSDERAELAVKRGVAVRQLVDRESRSRGPVIVAGDFNADPDRPEFREDTLFKTFSEAGYADALLLLPPSGRGTHPNRRYGDSALDHVMLRGFSPDRTILVPNNGLSDHLAVCTRAKP